VAVPAPLAMRCDLAEARRRHEERLTMATLKTAFGDRRRRDVFDALDALERQHGVDLRRLAQTPEAADRDRARLASRVAADPIFRRWVQHLSHDARRHKYGSPPLTEPWMALGEQRMFTLALAADLYPVRILDGYSDEPDTVKRMREAAVLFMSQTYLWSKAVFDTVRACPMPRHVIARDILPYPFTYHTTEVAHDVIETTHFGATTGMTNPVIDWMGVTDLPNQHGCKITMGVTDFASPASGMLLAQSGLHYNQTFPDDFPEAAQAPVAMLLSMFAFLNSPFASVEQRKLPRQWRRHGEVAPADIDTEIAVVTLRQAARDAVETYNAESRAWKHRWWVRGHFRKQWRPSKQAHEVIWIAPFLKGPSEAPMLQKVYAVRR
jgi:hypothetical protein